MISHVSTSSFSTEVLESKLPVMVCFTATWCGPCGIVSPIIDKLTEEFEGRVKIVNVDIDQAGEAFHKYNIRGIPTFVFFNSGEEVDRHVGASLDEEQFRKLLNGFV